MTNRVRQLRLDREMTQEELAALLTVHLGKKISRAVVVNVESGKRNVEHDPDLIAALSKSLKVSPAQLFIEHESA